MRDFLGATLSVALPWSVGALWVATLWRGDPDRRVLLCVGYGYLVGAFATTVLLRLFSFAGLHWNLAWTAGALIGLGCAGWVAAKPLPSLRAAYRRSAASLAAMPPTSRKVFWLFLALSAISTAALACCVAWGLILPFDALTQWADKSRVYYDHGRIMPFVDAAEWRRVTDTLHFWDSNPRYPATVPLLQVWTVLSLGHWDESLMNIPWVAAVVALGCAFYAEVRRLGAGPAKSMACTYLLLSLPFLQIHVAVAGMADIFVAVAYGLAAFSLWHWTIGRQWQDAALAFVMAVFCATLKNEGSLWALTLAPAILVALHRRAGLALTASIAVAVILSLAFGPNDLRIMGYRVDTRAANVILPVYEHMFVMDNWHLLWYAAIAIIVFNGRRLLGQALAPMTTTMLASAGFVLAVYFFSGATAGVAQENLVNRFLLHTVPALAFYLMLILRERERWMTVGDPAAPPTPAGSSA